MKKPHITSERHVFSCRAGYRNVVGKLTPPRSTVGDLLVAPPGEDRHPMQKSGLTAPARVYQGYSSVKGLNKTENQDRIVILRGEGDLSATLSPSGAVSSSRDEDTLLFSAIFDGHGGLETSAIAAEWMYSLTVESNRDFWETLGQLGNGCSISESNMTNSWDLAQADSDDTDGCMVQELRLWREAFSQMDNMILQRSRDSGSLDGATALVALHVGPFLSVANAGDSRAVLSRGKVAVRLTRDHTPEMESERKRIECAGGVVRHLKGTWRVCLPTYDGKYIKLCATSRGLGDRDFKDEGLMICEPEVTNVVLLPHADEFTVMASDGVWGFVADQDVVDAVSDVISEMQGIEASMQSVAAEAARRLVGLALDRGSFDDISVLVNLYSWGPNIEPPTSSVD